MKCCSKTPDKKMVKKRIIRKSRYKVAVVGEIDDETYNNVIAAMGQYIEDPSKYSGITLYITSLGGDVHIGFALYDFFRALNTSIYTVALGECTSAATIIFALGKKRYVGENTVCLMHSVSIGNSGCQNKREISECITRMQIYNSKLQKIYKNVPGVTEEYQAFIDDVFDNTRETSLGAEELLKFGFATDVYNDINETS